MRRCRTGVLPTAGAGATYFSFPFPGPAPRKPYLPNLPHPTYMAFNMATAILVILLPLIHVSRPATTAARTFVYSTPYQSRLEHSRNAVKTYFVNLFTPHHNIANSKQATSYQYCMIYRDILSGCTSAEMTATKFSAGLASPCPFLKPQPNPRQCRNTTNESQLHCKELCDLVV